MNYTIAALPGDGIGPEIMESGLTLLETLGKKFQHEFNVTVYPFPEEPVSMKPVIRIPPQTIKGCSEADAILLAAIGGPKWETAEKHPKMACCNYVRHWDFSRTSVRLPSATASPTSPR